MKPKTLFITLLVIATILLSFIIVSALKVENITCEKVDTSLYAISVETETFETNSTMKFMYFSSGWNPIDTDTYPTEEDGKYRWYGIWDTSSLPDGTYVVKAVWKQNSSIIGESDLLTVTIDSNPPGPPSPTTPPPSTTPPQNVCIEFYSKDFIVPHTHNTYTLSFEIENTNRSFVFYIKNTGTVDLDSLSIVGYRYYENVRWQLSSTHLEPDMVAQATLNIKGSEIKETSLYTFYIMEGDTPLKTIKLEIVKKTVKKVTYRDLNPLLDGEKYGIILKEPEKICVVSINTKGLTEEQLKTLFLVYRGNTINITGENTPIEIEADYGVVNILYLYQKINDQYLLIHSWTVEREKMNVTYDIDAQDIDSDGYLEPEKNDEITVSFIVPERGNIILQGIDNERDEKTQNVRFKKYLLSEGKYKIILEAEDYLPVILKLKVKKKVIETVQPTTTPPPTTVPPTTLPHTTVPHPTTPPPQNKNIRKVFTVAIVLMSGILIYLIGAKKGVWNISRLRKKIKQIKKEKPKKRKIKKTVQKEKTHTSKKKILDDLENDLRKIDEELKKNGIDPKELE